MKYFSLVSATVLAAALIAAPAVAADPKPDSDQPTPVTGVDVPSKKPVKIICRTMHELGTRIGGKRICLTKEEWDDRRLQDRQSLEKVQAGTRAPRG